MGRGLQEDQVPIGFLREQVALKVEEIAQFSKGGIRYKVKKPVLQVALVFKDVQVRKRYSW